MARSFNGTSDVITIPSFAYFNTAASRTISFWYNCAALPAAYAGIFMDTVNTGLQVYIKSTGALGVYGNVFGNFTPQDPLSGSTVSTNTWNNFVIASISAGNANIYLNGSLIFTQAQIANSSIAALSYVFGNDTQNAGRFFNGKMADVTFWNNAGLVALEATALARGVRPNKVRPAALQAWWPLDGLQSPEPDLSGFKNNGTLTGTAKAFGPPITMFTPRWPQKIETAAAAAAAQFIFTPAIIP